MKVVDLTHVIEEKMPVYPGMEAPLLQEASTFEKNRYRETRLILYSHTGTHMDAPAHMLEEGLFLDQLEAGHFIGKAVVLDFDESRYRKITQEDLKQHEEKIAQAEFVVLKTGWSKYWGTDRYFGEFPYLDDEAALWLSDFKLKGVGIDAFSVDSMHSTAFSVHKILLEKNIVIIENLASLEAIEEEFFMLSALPMRTRKADGAPVRAVCIQP